jgi:hypothetical protein
MQNRHMGPYLKEAIMPMDRAGIQQGNQEDHTIGDRKASTPVYY